jgi:vacuolar-type H+-ATPase subunit E/Vma4
MTKETESGQENGIVQSILAEAEAQAQRIIESARKIVEAENERTRKEVEANRQEILAKADERAKKIRAREVATAHVESQRVLLKAREDAVTNVVARIEEGLRALRKDAAQYRQSLLNLACEAIGSVGGNEVRLVVSNADREFLDHEFLDAVGTALRAQLGSAPAIVPEFREDDLDGGCVALSPNGRVVYENTFPRRLERMRRRLRASIVREIRKENEDE